MAAATTIPETHLDLFDEAALGHVTYVDGRGRLVAFPMWVDHRDGRLLTSSPVGSKKGRSLRERPQVGISIVSLGNPWHWLSISGQVVGISPDEGLAFIDRMARRFTGHDYGPRTPRELFEIEIDRVGTSRG